MHRSAATRVLASVLTAVLTFAGLTLASPAFAASADESVSYTGRVAQLADEDLPAGEGGGSRLFTVPGSGQLRIDASGIDLAPAAFQSVTLRLAVPAGLSLPDDESQAFAELAEASIDEPLVALENLTVSGRSSLRTDALVNQTPATAATHKVFAVLVTPAGGPASASPNQTAEKVATSVSHADSYWNQQSSGKVRFQLAGATSWYKSGYSCATVPGSEQLWTEAAGIAAAQLGYEPAQNVHLVLFFPSELDPTPDCAGSIGLASVGSSLNEGGVAWVQGTDAPIEKATLAHELGHNLTLGHASWIDCPVTSASTGKLSSSCSAVRPYGDVVDVMGFGITGMDGGALSSPSAIRAGIWPSSAYSVKTTTAAQSFTLSPVSGNSGRRAVVIEDRDGTNYFIEFRNFTGEDAQFAGGGCSATAGYCVNNGPEVRVLKMEQQYIDGGDFFYAFKGFPGDDSLLLGRTVGGVERGGYKKGEKFASPLGITMTVTALSASSATVKVTKTDTTVRGSYVTIVPTLQADPDELRAGDTLTAFLEAPWTATSYSYQWYRATSSKDTAISGATKQSYTLTASDVGKYIWVKVVGSSGSTKRTAVDPDLGYYLGYGPVVEGVIDTGSVTIDANAYPFKAVLTGWTTTGVKYAYQWYRNGGTKISGATASSYTPTAADRGTTLSVTVTASKSGSPSQTRSSAAANYTLDAAGTLAVSGIARVGENLSVNSLSYTKSIPTPGTAVPSPTVTYQWYRSGAAIPGAKSPSYTPVAADYGKVIKVVATAAAPGTISHTATATLAGTIAKGVIAGTQELPQVTKTVAGSKITLTAALPAGSISEPGAKTVYQWYRGSSAISKATKSSYVLTSSDVAKDLKVKVTVTKSNYTTVALTSLAQNYTVQAGGAVTLAGTAAVNSVLTAVLPSWSAGGSPAAPTLAYQWYRDGKAISGAKSSTFLLTASDYGKKISLKVTASASGFQSRTFASASTGKVAKGVFGGTRELPAVTKSVSGTKITLTAVPAADAVTVLAPQTAAAKSYQWYRSGSAISKATKSSYVLTSADYGKLISVKVSYAKTAFTTVALTSTPTGYSVLPTGATTSAVPVATPDGVAVGTTLSVAGRSYSNDAVQAFQWYASGKAIAGAISADFTLTSAQLGKTITVKVTATASGYLPAVATSAATQKVGLEALEGWDAAVSVDKGVVGTKITLTAIPGVVEPGAAHAYQWYRGSTAISKATKAAYVLTSADAGKELSVRVTSTKSAYTSVVATSAKVNYSLVPAAALTLSTLAPKVNQVIVVTPPGYSPSAGAVAYQWYADGKAITNATGASYTPTSAVKGKALTVKVTATTTGYLSSVLTSAKTAKVAG